MKDIYLYGIMAVNEFMHGFVMAFLTLFTAENIFGRQCRKSCLLPIVTGIVLSALVTGSVVFNISRDVTFIIIGVFLLSLIIGWLLLTDRKLGSLLALAFAMLFSEAVVSAMGNTVFGAMSVTGLSGRVPVVQLSGYLIVYIAATLYMKLIFTLSRGSDREPLPMLYIAGISIMVTLLSEMSPEGYSLREMPEIADGSQVMYSSVILLCISLLIVFVIKTTRSRYLEKLNHLNEEYLNIQSRHFETVRRNDTEIRRINHDMRNHIFCMNELCRTGKYDELTAYLRKLSGDVSNAQQRVKTGSGMADAIIGEKAASAERYNVRFDISGDLGLMDIPAYELCTILANLLDNAVEAASYFCVKHRVVTVSCKGTENFTMLTVSNGTAMNVDTSSRIMTVKEDKISHGFGLENVRKAVERLGGELVLSCEPYGGEFIFTAEVIFPNNNIKN